MKPEGFLLDQVSTCVSSPQSKSGNPINVLFGTIFLDQTKNPMQIWGGFLQLLWPCWIQAMASWEPPRPSAMARSQRADRADTADTGDRSARRERAQHTRKANGEAKWQTHTLESEVRTVDEEVSMMYVSLPEDTPPKIDECPLKRDHIKRKFHLPTINFQGIC